MAINRCFDTFNPNMTSSDYIHTTRQKTVFNDVNNNIIELNNANPQKKNGFRYNSNFGVRSAQVNEGNKACLAFANNYQHLLDITKGKTIITNQNISCPDNINPKQTMDAPVFDAWSGNLYSVNYNEHNVTSALTFDQENCVYYVDPLNELFYQACPIADKLEQPPLWFNTVDISFNNTAYYIEANRSQLLHGLYYPEKVVFGSTI
jgi:hypothetical protein